MSENRIITTVEELLAALKDGTLKDKVVKIIYADLWNADLRNADLWNANLRDANLRDADLWNADLWNADLRNANLSSANLRNANLRNANLWDANLLDAIGIYSVAGLGMSSRQDVLYGGVTIRDGKLELLLHAGCQTCTPDELREKVLAKHGTNTHAQQYEVAISTIEKLFAIDMAASKWDYLLTWNEDHTKVEVVS